MSRAVIYIATSIVLVAIHSKHVRAESPLDPAVDPCVYLAISVCQG